MAVRWTDIEVPLGGGVDTKTDEKLLKPPTVADLQNAVFSAAPGYEKRNGYTAGSREVDGQTALSSAVGLATRQDELILFDDKNLHSYDENNNRWIQKGRIVSYTPTIETVANKQADQTLADTVTNNNVTAVAWLDDGDSLVHYSVYSALSDTTYVSDTSIATSTKPKLLAVGNYIHIYYIDTGSSGIKVVIIDTNDPTDASPSSATIVTDCDTDYVYDVCQHPGKEKGFVFYKRNNGGTPEGYGIFVNAGGTTGVEATITTTASVNDFACCACDANTSFIYIFVAETTGCARIQCSLDLASTTEKTHTAGANVENCAVAADQDTLTEAYFFWELTNATDWKRIVEYRPYSLAIGGGGGSASQLLNASLASGAWYFKDHGYVHLRHDTTLQRSYFVFEDTGVICGRHLPGIADACSQGHLPNVQGVNNSTSKFAWAAGYRMRLKFDPRSGTDIPDAATDIYGSQAIKRLEYDFAATDRYQSVEHGKSCYISGGMLWEYDGTNLVEQGFLVFPEAITTAQSTAGALTPGGTYNYRVYYEWYNEKGERQRSTTAQTVTVPLTGSNDDITLTIPCLTLTNKGADVGIAVYRTEADANVIAGAPFYRVSDPDPTNSAGANRYVTNDPTATTVAFLDQLADSNILDRELDYLNTGELDNVAPAECSIMGTAKDRVWLAGFEDGVKLQFSKLNLGGDQLEFHDGLVVQLPEVGGAITAIGELNHFVVAFKKDRIYVISGEGPNNLGNGVFNTPQLVTTDVGCKSQDSIVRTPLGLMFQSDKGIYLLGQNLEVVYVGAPVEDYNSQTITAATLVNDANQVRFLTNAGRTLVFDYFFKQWTTFTNHVGVDAVLWKGSTYCYLRSTGQLMKETAGLYTDDGVHFSMVVKTAPLTVGGAQGYQRVRKLMLLGTYYSAHELRVKCFYDHGPEADRGTWDPSDILNLSAYGSGAYGAGAYGGSGSPVYQADFRLPRQKCQVVQFEIDDKQSTAGRAMELSHLQLEVGAKRGPGKLESARRFSATGKSTV